MKAHATARVIISSQGAQAPSWAVRLREVATRFWPFGSLRRAGCHASQVCISTVLHSVARLCPDRHCRWTPLWRLGSQVQKQGCEKRRQSFPLHQRAATPGDTRTRSRAQDRLVSHEGNRPEAGLVGLMQSMATVKTTRADISTRPPESLLFHFKARSSSILSYAALIAASLSLASLMNSSGTPRAIRRSGWFSRTSIR